MEVVQIPKVFLPHGFTLLKYNKEDDQESPLYEEIPVKWVRIEVEFGNEMNKDGTESNIKGKIYISPENTCPRGLSFTPRDRIRLPDSMGAFTLRIASILPVYGSLSKPHHVVLEVRG